MYKKALMLNTLLLAILEEYSRLQDSAGSQGH